MRRDNSILGLRAFVIKDDVKELAKNVEDNIKYEKSNPHNMRAPHVYPNIAQLRFNKFHSTWNTREEVTDQLLFIDQEIDVDPQS